VVLSQNQAINWQEESLIFLKPNPIIQQSLCCWERRNAYTELIAVFEKEMFTPAAGGIWTL